MPLSNSAWASGEASADFASAKSRVPASMTVCPGRNLRVAGLGVCSVRISMAAMWSRRAVSSTLPGFPAVVDHLDDPGEILVAAAAVDEPLVQLLGFAAHRR